MQLKKPAGFARQAFFSSLRISVRTIFAAIVATAQHFTQKRHRVKHVKHVKSYWSE
jgi:hypothetical protein